MAMIEDHNTGCEVKPRTVPQLIITIDGPAGVGKSTVAKLLASRLGYLYLDTGSLYRAIAWTMIEAGIDPSDTVAVTVQVAKLSLQMQCHNGAATILVNGQDVTPEIRTPTVTAVASVISAIAAVRACLLPIQHEISKGRGVVADGRDMGTKVFPSAAVKFFLEAEPNVRAQRRHQELVTAGYTEGLEQTRADLASRDTQDRSRSIAPLVPASDARLIDTSTFSATEVVDQMMVVIAAKL